MTIIPLVTDASNDGWGTQIWNELMKGLRSLEQESWNINEKEMWAVYIDILKNARSLEGKSLCPWYLQCCGRLIVEKEFAT